jgi:hypothetical protein
MLKQMKEKIKYVILGLGFISVALSVAVASGTISPISSGFK